MTAIEYHAIERNLQLLIESCVGVAKQTLKATGRHVPGEARRVFEKLQADGLDDSGIPWRQVIGLRNALVHDYLNIDRALVVSIIVDGYHRQLLEFARARLQ